MNKDDLRNVQVLLSTKVYLEQLTDNLNSLADNLKQVTNLINREIELRKFKGEIQQ